MTDVISPEEFFVQHLHRALKSLAYVFKIYMKNNLNWNEMEASLSNFFRETNALELSKQEAIQEYIDLNPSRQQLSAFRQLLHDHYNSSLFVNEFKEYLSLQNSSGGSLRKRKQR